MIENIMPYIVFIVGFYISLMNWLIFFNNTFKKGSSSYGLFIGGLLLGIGMATMPFLILRKFWFTAFFIDFGCIPWLIMGIIYYSIRVFKQFFHNQNK